jgi:hypothetical protein
MTTVSTTETEPAQEPFVRFAAFRGKVPLPWVTVFVLASSWRPPTGSS